MKSGKQFLSKSLNCIKNKVTRIQEPPVIVLGNPKSGTSVIGHLLADYGGLSKTIDIPEEDLGVSPKLRSAKNNEN